MVSWRAPCQNTVEPRGVPIFTTPETNPVSGLAPSPALRSSAWRGCAARRALYLIALWLVSVGFSLAALARYETTPGTESTVATTWPAGSQLPRTTHTATLVMFAHPHCPCTRATLAQFERLLAVSPHVDGLLVLVQPEATTHDWADTALARDAAAIPRLTLAVDPAGQEARSFGVTTSGHVLLYDGAGRLQFSGGITASRGQQGENAGLESLESLLAGAAPNARSYAVYGCPLLGASDCCPAKGTLCPAR